jgi:hypothetical protein
MKSAAFVSVKVRTHDGTDELQFINTDHIIRVYEQNNIIYVELTEYTTLELHNENIHSFMDRFVQ